MYSETGDFAVNDRIETHHPDAQTWITHVGFRHARRCGGRMKRVVWDRTLLTILVDEADSELLVDISLIVFHQQPVKVFEGDRVELR